MASNVGLGGEIVFIAAVNIEVVRFKVADDGDLRRFFKIPKLETTHFVNNDGSWLETV